MTATHPTQYIPNDRLVLLQGLNQFGTGAARKINLSAKFVITEDLANDTYNVDTVAAAATLSGSNITNSGLSGTSIIDSTAPTAVGLRSIEPGSTKVTVSLDTGNKAVSIDVTIPVSALSDAVIASPANNDVLTYETATSKWKNKPAPSGGGGSSTLATLTDVTLTSPANNDVIVYDSATSKWKNKAPSTEKIGKSTASGNGTTTVFNIAHGLGSNPTYAFIVCSSLTNTFTYTTDSTNIVVTFATAPASGSSNVTIYWRVVP